MENNIEKIKDRTKEELYYILSKDHSIRDIVFEIRNQEYSYCKKSIDSYMFLLKEDKDIANKFCIKAFIDYVDYLNTKVLIKKQNNKLLRLFKTTKQYIEKTLLSELSLLPNENDKKKVFIRFLNKFYIQLLINVFQKYYNFTEEEACAVVDIASTILHYGFDNSFYINECIENIKNQWRY